VSRALWQFSRKTNSWRTPVQQAATAVLHKTFLSLPLIQHSMGQIIKSPASFYLSVCRHSCGCNFYSILMKFCVEVRDSVCPLCQEEEDTTAHFIAQCSALMLLRKNILGDYILSSDTLSNIHWFLLLKIARASFYWPCGLSGFRIGPMLWPQRCVPAHAAIHPAGKVR